MSSRYGLRSSKQNEISPRNHQKVYKINIDDLQKSKQQHQIFKASRISRRFWLKEQFFAALGTFMLASCTTTFFFNPLYQIFKPEFLKKKPTKLFTDEDPDDVALTSLTKHKSIESWEFRTVN